MGAGPSAITAWQLFLSVPMEGIQTRNEECATHASTADPAWRDGEKLEPDTAFRKGRRMTWAALIKCV